MKISTDLFDFKGKMIYSDSVLMVRDADVTEVGNVYFSAGSFKWREALLSDINNSAVIIGTSASCEADGWFDGLDKFTIKSEKNRNISECDYPDDCSRILDCAKDLGFSISLAIAQSIWISHSEKSMAGWLYLPKSTKELSKIILPFLKKIK